MRQLVARYYIRGASVVKANWAPPASLRPYITPQFVVGAGRRVLEAREVAYRCHCSRDRAVNAVTVLGASGIQAVLAQDAGERQVVIDCEFCKRHYVVGEEELRHLARRLAAGPASA